MRTRKKQTQVKRWRAMVGDKYCSLNTNLHVLGVCVPDATQETAYVFTNQLKLNNAIERTAALQKEIRESMIPNFKGFAPLKFEGSVTVEEFLEDIDNGD